MEWFSQVDWNRLFIPGTPLLEIFARGSVMYLAVFFLLRVILTRSAGSIGVSDILLVVLISEAAQGGLAGDYHSLPDGILLVATLIFWNYSLEWLSFRFPFMAKLIQGAPLALVKNGRMIHANMKRELITEEELMAQLRLNGVKDVAQVKKACLESDGKISVVKI